MLATEPLIPNPGRLAESDHLRFLRRRLDRVSRLWSEGRQDDSTVIAQASDDRFWELLGIRVLGCPGVMLGAVQFRRQQKGDRSARQSLPYFLATPAAVGDGLAASGRPLVSVELPTALESVAEFLERLAGSTDRNPVLVDRACIQLAFDLRSRNPSVEKLGQSADSKWQQVILRTRDGHVLSGNLLDTVRKLRSDLPFVALTMVVQHSLHGNVPLPTLCLDRQYISMLYEVDESTSGEDPLNRVGFQPWTANSLHLVFGD